MSLPSAPTVNDYLPAPAASALKAHMDAPTIFFLPWGKDGLPSQLLLYCLNDVTLASMPAGLMNTLTKTGDSTWTCA